ncbi:MAG: calcium/sodium antiporter [Eubacteriales bacterium]
MLIPVILFAIGLLCLIKGGDWFVDGASGIARRFRLPELLIGATVVSIGTTLPEVMVSATDAVTGMGQIAYGNAIGSIICNTALVAAITIAVRPSKINRATLITPVVAFFVAAAFYVAVSYIYGSFSRITGIILLCMFVIYMAVTVFQMKKGGDTSSENEPEPEKNQIETDSKKLLVRYILGLVVGAALIAIGAKLLVDNGTIIAENLGVPQSVIALTFVALGTSLPELVTAITALAKGHSALSLGNIIGANLFNIVLVSGLSITLKPFDIPVEATIGGYNASLVLDIPVMIFAMAFMTLPALIRGKLSRFQGIILLAVYAVYCFVQFAVIP